MIDWVHEAGKGWGAYMRHTPKAWPEKSISWRTWRERGASGGTFGPRNPQWQMAAETAEIHRIWRGMPEEMSAVMVAFYVKRCAPARKAEMLTNFLGKEIKVTKLYELVTNAHYYIAGRFDEKDSGKTPPENDDVAVSSGA